MSQWFYMKADTRERFGPFEDRELKQQADQGLLTPTDLLWRQGMAKPHPAGGLKGLFTAPVTRSASSGIQGTVPSAGTGSPVESVTGQTPSASPGSPSPGASPYGFSSLSDQTPVSPFPMTTDQPMSEEEMNSLFPVQTTTEQPGTWQPSPLVQQRTAQRFQQSYTAPVQPPMSREDQLWEEGSFSQSEKGGLWSIIHQFGAAHRWIYFVIPLVIALPLGLLCGIIDAVNPLVFISFIVVAVAYGFLGKIVFACFKGAGIRVRLLSAGYGFLAATIGIWAFVLGGMLWDFGQISPSEDEPRIPLTAMANPANMVTYIKFKAQIMSVGKIGQSSDKKPDPIGNYLLIIGILVVGYICTVGAAWGPMQLNSETEQE